MLAFSRWFEQHATAMSALATLMAVAVALFWREIVRWWRRPRLTATLRARSPDCVMTFAPFTHPVTEEVTLAGCFYLRLWVENFGHTAARRVQVFASRLSRMRDDGSWVENDQFLPMNLRWSHSQQRLSGPEIFAQMIAPQMGKHCDLGHILDPDRREVFGLEEQPWQTVDGDAHNTVLSLDLEVKPKTQTHLIAPGRHCLELRVAAANAEPVTVEIEFILSGAWIEDEGRAIPGMIEVRRVT